MNNDEYDTKYIKALDGIRALSIMIIVWFHIWQQSWLMPIIGNISLDFIPRFGFLLVDMMILLSSVCLFIPYARSKIYKEEIPSTKKFYIRRFARIFPSYYLSMIIALIFIAISFAVKSLADYREIVLGLILFLMAYTNYVVYDNYYQGNYNYNYDMGGEMEDDQYENNIENNYEEDEVIYYQ